MRPRVRLSTVKWRAWARDLRARGPLARAVACAVVAFAAILWLAAAVTLLRLLLLVVLVVAAAWCVRLVWAVWRQRPADDDAPASEPLAWTRLRHELARRLAPAAVESVAVRSRGSDERAPDALERLQRVLDEHRAVVAALRDSVEAFSRDVLGRQERLTSDSERLTRDLAAGVDAMRSLLAQIERGVPPTAVRGSGAAAEPPPARPSPLSAEDLRSTGEELDVDAVYREIEAELKLEAIEEREQSLVEAEERLSRRERELALFVAQTQSRLD
jgi:hypothetical protein